MVKRLLRATCCLVLLTFSLPAKAEAQDITGVWATNQGDWLFFVATNTDALIAVRLLANLDEAQVYLGQIDNDQFDLVSLDRMKTLNGSVSGRQMTGSFTQPGVGVSPFTAGIFLDYLGSAADGIWYTDLGNFLLIATVLFQNEPVMVIADIDVGLFFVSFDMLAGSFISDTFSGLSLFGQGALTISFDGNQASGFYGHPLDPLRFDAYRLLMIKQPWMH